MKIDKKLICAIAASSTVTAALSWSMASRESGSALADDRILIAEDAAKTDATPSAPLQAGIQKVDISLEKLRDIGLDLKQVTTSARHLYDEVSIQPVSLVTTPEVIGRGIIINIPVGTNPVGPPAPPNPRRVESAMSAMRPIIETLKTNADSFVTQHKELDVSPETQEKMAPLVQDWVKAANNLAGQLGVLEPLVKGPNYDNGAIAKVCQNIQQDAYVLDKIRRDAYKIIKKEEKKKKDAKNS